MPGLSNVTTVPVEEAPADDDGSELARIVFVIAYPIIIVGGVIGNILTFIVMRRGSMRDVSTCFYMRILALVDTGRSCVYMFLYENISPV